MSRVEADGALADLARLDAVLLDAQGRPALAWGFLDETLAAASRHRWDFATAAWAVLASRARRAGLRESLDVDAACHAILSRLPRGAPGHAVRKK